MKTYTLWLAFLTLSLYGCDGSQGSEQPGAVTVRILSWDETQELAASKKGKVVVLDVWSTTCAPCKIEFPRLVELQEKYGKDKVACISVSCDYLGIEGEPPESYRAEVLAFLKKMRAEFDNVLLNTPSDEFFTAIDLGSIPAVYVYGPDGKVQKRFDNDREAYGKKGFTYEKDVIPLVEQLLVAD